MSTPSPHPWLFLDLARARQEIARLRAMHVVDAAEAEQLNQTIHAREERLLALRAQKQQDGAEPLYRLLAEGTASDGGEPLPETLVDRLDQFYRTRQPELGASFGPLRPLPETSEPAPEKSAEGDAPALEILRATVPEASLDETKVPSPASPPAPPDTVTAGAPAPAAGEAGTAVPAADRPGPGGPAWSIDAFFERVNIGWGMLAASLLIVGCSVALVVSLWQSRDPLVRYFTFLGVTVALHGFGHFTSGRLGLAITGRTMLALSLLLMPLNLVAADVLGGPHGRAIGPEASAVIWIGLAALAATAFRRVTGRKTRAASTAFALLLGAQLLVVPMGHTPAMAWLPWAAAIVVLGGLAVTLRRVQELLDRSADRDPTVPLLFVGGLLGYAALALFARFHFEVRITLAAARLAPPLILCGLGGLALARALLTRTPRSSPGHALGATLATVIHFLLPLALLVHLDSGLDLLPVATALLVTYGVVSLWHRSAAAVAALAVTWGIVGYAVVLSLHGTVAGLSPWLPASLPTLAQQMLPFATLLLVAGEAVWRHGTPGHAPPLAWASRPLLLVGLVLAAGLVGINLLDADRGGETVVGIGVFMAALFLWTRRQGYAYAALAAPFVLLWLEPAWLEPWRPVSTLATETAALAALWAVAGYGLWRGASKPQHINLGRSALHVALVAAPLAVGLSLADGVTERTLIPVVTSLVATVFAGLVHRHRVWPWLAGAWYVAAAAVALHAWVAPITSPVPATIAWALAAAAALLSLGMVLERRPPAAGSHFARPALGWGVALLFMQPVLFAATTPWTTSAVCAVAAAGLWFVLAAHQRHAAWTVIGMVFLFLASFLVYHRADPFLEAWVHALVRSGIGPIPAWLALAPMATAAVLLVLAVGARAGWRKRVFAGPALVGALAAALIAVGLIVVDPMPARKVWTLSLGSGVLIAILFRSLRLSALPLVLLGLVWMASIGWIADVTRGMDDREHHLPTLLILATALVAALGVTLEAWRPALAATPRGAWLRKVSTVPFSVGHRVLSWIVLVVVAFGAAINVSFTERVEQWLPGSPGLVLLAVLVLLAAWIHAARRVHGPGRGPQYGLAIGASGVVALGWTAAWIGTPEAWRWLATALSVWAIAWLAPAPGLRRYQSPIRFLRISSGTLVGGLTAALVFCIALAGPDQPATVVSLALFAAHALHVAVRRRSIPALQTGMILVILAAFALLHRLHPVFTREGIAWLRFVPQAALALALAAGAWVLGYRDLVRERHGQTPFFPSSRPLRLAGLAMSQIAVALVMISVLPAMDVPPTTSQASHVVGAAILVVLALGYLVVAGLEQESFPVYLAEAMVVLISLHLRATHPWIFRLAIFRRFWPLVLVAISYGATFLEQILLRIRVSRVYANPLRFTGLLLPVGPLVGVWYRPEIDTVLISTVGAIAGFYAMIAYLHRSVPFAYLSTAVANTTMFAWASKLGFAFTVHPQIFLWPVGLSLIGVAHVQRRSLEAETVRSLRAIGACIIYGSMATAVFTDVAHQTLEMILLAVTAVAGIAAGMGLRIRAFLYAGFGFLVFDVVYMVFRIGREDPWVWWMAGIALGMAIITAFAFFEKRRHDVERWVRVLKTWE